MMHPDRNWFVSVLASREAVVDLSLLSPDLTFCEVVLSWLNSPGDDPVALTSLDWEHLDRPEAVREAAKKKIDEANDFLRQDSSLHTEIQVGGIVWQRDPGLPNGCRRHFTIIAASATIVGTSSMTAFVSSASGYVTYPARTVGLRQRELADRNADFNAAVILFEAAGEDYHRLWLVWEYVKKRSGHRPRVFASAADIDAFTSTANNGTHLRHIGEKFWKPQRSMPPREARALMRRLLEGWLQAENPH